MAELQRKKQKSVGTVCKDAIMTGISYMIPVIVGGGVITAIAKMMGGYNIGDTAAEMQTLAQVIFTIGNNLFAFAVPESLVWQHLLRMLLRISRVLLLDMQWVYLQDL